jgi:hypothetical protein
LEPLVNSFFLKRIRLTGDNALSEPLLRSDPEDLFLRTLTDNRDVISPSILTANVSPAGDGTLAAAPAV